MHFHPILFISATVINGDLSVGKIWEKNRNNNIKLKLELHIYVCVYVNIYILTLSFSSQVIGQSSMFIIQVYGDFLKREEFVLYAGRCGGEGFKDYIN